MNKTAEAHLQDVEAEKRTKYAHESRNQQKDFCPFGVTCDGVTSKGADAILRRIVTEMSNRTGMIRSRVAAIVKTKIQLATLRAASMCIRCRRVRKGKKKKGESDLRNGGGMTALQAPIEVGDWF